MSAWVELRGTDIEHQIKRRLISLIFRELLEMTVANKLVGLILNEIGKLKYKH